MKKRILWLSFLITAVALVLFSVVSTQLYYTTGVRHSRDYLSAYMGAVDETREFSDAYCEELSGRLGGARVTFLSHTGEILADTGGDGAGGERGTRPEVELAMTEGEGFDVRASETVGKNLAYFCKKFERGLVRISVPTSSFLGVYLDALPAVAVFLVLDAFACLFVTYLTTGFMLRPMEQLARDAAAKKRVEVKDAELRPVADILNRMNEEEGARAREIEEEKELVVRVQKSKDEFIANITHEMNTPLTSIKGFAELLSTGELSEEQAARAANTILTQSERLANLIACIINYDEIDSEELPLYEVNATKIAKELLETLAPAIGERKLSLTAEIAEDVVLRSRYERVTEIFGNIIRNAIRYNRDGGSVCVRLTKEEFSVTDTGVGISEEDLPRIFDRFYTVDKSHGGKHGGFGLGLSVVKKLCEKEGWKLLVTSKLGSGSEFTVKF